MSLSPRGIARSARYALPGLAGRVLPTPDAKAVARVCERLRQRRIGATVGYFQADDAAPEEIVAAMRAVAAQLSAQKGGNLLAVKAPPLGFDPGHLRTIAEAASAAGLGLMFDAHAAKDAERTLQAVEELQAGYPETGFALPARWLRSAADAAVFKESAARIRIVKGEWPDPEWADPDIGTNFLSLAARLAGRAAPVAVATHDPALASEALLILREAGTPCELEQLRGLPRRRTMALAERLGVPVRLYLPFGPGWWPYAIDKALARPYLPVWAVKDWLGRD